MAVSAQRWELQNLLPIAFVLWIIASMWSIYFSYHLLPLLEGALSPQPQGHRSFVRGCVETVVSQTLVALLLVSLFRAMFTDPGSVPRQSNKTERGYDVLSSSPFGPPYLPATEVKRSGEPRFCKWCNCYKPDRTHHCRACKSCILRMDHHCPWISNCVGFRNHKFFLLVVIYSLTNCLFNIFTMMDTVKLSVLQETPSVSRFLLVFCLTTSVIMAFVLLPFFGFHAWLMLGATTTIEFCEKMTKPGQLHIDRRSKYDRGFFNNVCAVLGPHPLLWLLPVSPPTGEGVSFVVRGQDDDGQIQDIWETTPPIRRSSSQEKRETGAGVGRASQKLPGAAVLAGPEVTGEEAALV